MSGFDLSKVVEITDGIHWVGTGCRAFLSRNSYLRRFSGEGKTMTLLIDPGPPVDMEVISGKIASILGDVNRISMFYVNHQDPDVVGNLPLFSRLNPQAYILSTEDTWRLISLFGLDPGRFKAVERFTNGRVALPTGHRLQFVPTPFCHFRGACMLYDLESRILFSGDFFGGIAATDLFATEGNWVGIRAFHQLYMPSNDALRLGVERIRKLDPSPVMIAPQHGGIIREELMDDFLSRMESLSVGLDIMTTIKDELPVLIDALNEILTAARAIIGEEKVAACMRLFHPDGSYPAFFALSRDDRVLEIKGEPFETVEALIKILFRDLPPERKGVLTSRIFHVLIERGLPPFDALISQAGGTVQFLAIEG